MKKAVVLVNKITGNSNPDEQDVLIQADEVEKALYALGYKTERVFVDLDLQFAFESLEKASPDLVFNLVETLGGKAELIHLIPALLESIHIPFTGSGSFPMYMTSDKIRSKILFSGSGIPSPAWFVSSPDAIPDKNKYYIIKPVWEDGSVGITDESVIKGDDPQLLKVISSGKNKYFAEEYIKGREFNISMLGSIKGPVILPPAEIRFIDYPSNKHHILNYASKWDENSFEYHHSVRSFDFSGEDMKLLEELKAIAYLCWGTFELRGYARIDFRVDENNKPFVLEVNANPCLSPDAGFIAAANRAGLNYKDVVERIVSDI